MSDEIMDDTDELMNCTEKRKTWTSLQDKTLLLPLAIHLYIKHGIWIHIFVDVNACTKQCLLTAGYNSADDRPNSSGIVKEKRNTKLTAALTINLRKQPNLGRDLECSDGEIVLSCDELI